LASGTPCIFRPNSTFLRTDSHGKSEYCWNTTPRSEPGLCTAFPSTSTFPALGATKPATRLSSVDFPHPEGPISDTNSPGSIPNDTPLTACIAPPFPSNSTPALLISTRPRFDGWALSFMVARSSNPAHLPWTLA
jgi:hypothetical protein